MSTHIVPARADTPEPSAHAPQIDVALRLMDEWESLPAHTREVTWEGDEIIVRGLTLQMFKAVAAAEDRPVEDVIASWVDDASQRFSEPRPLTRSGTGQAPEG